MPSIVKQAAEVEDEVAIAAEADTAAGDDKAKEAKVQEEPTLTVSVSPTLTEVSLAANGKL